MSYVFISYARRDHEIATQLMHLLAEHNILVKTDEQIEAGDGWQKSLWDILDDSSACVLLLSSASVRLPLVKHEYQYFLKHDKPIYPVVIEPLRPADLPFRLRHLAMMDMATDPEKAAAQLVERIKSGQPPTFDAQTSPRLVLEVPREQFNAQRHDIMDTVEKMKQENDVDEIVIRFVAEDNS